MAYFPLFVDLKDKKIIVVGGGNIALRKIIKLLPFEGKFTIISPDICIEIENLIKENSDLTYLKKNIEEKDLINSFLVISATDNKDINKFVCDTCKKYNIPINAVDDIENCTFLFPSLIKQDSLIIGCSTSGNAPEIAKLIKNKIQNILPQNFGKIIEYFGNLRYELKSILPEQKLRAKVCHRLLEYCQNKNFDIGYNELHQKMLNLSEDIDEKTMIK